MDIDIISHNQLVQEITHLYRLWIGYQLTVFPRVCLLSFLFFSLQTRKHCKGFHKRVDG